MSEHILNHIDELRSQLVNNEKFHDTMEYFLGNLAEDEDFRDLGERIPEHKAMALMLRKAAARIFSLKSPSLGRLLFVEVKEKSFLHGIFQLVDNQNFGTFFYFHEIDKGMVSFSSFTGQNYFARISLEEIELP